jgi:hypothetical protein
VAPPVFKTGLAANDVAGGFDSLPPPPRRFELFTNGRDYHVFEFLSEAD